MFEKGLEIGCHYIPLLDCPISIECYYQEYFEGFGIHHLGVGFIIVNVFFLGESSTNLPSLIFFDSPISLPFDQIYLFSVDDLGSFFDIRFQDFGEDLVSKRLFSFLDPCFCPFSFLWRRSDLLIGRVVWICSYCEYLWLLISDGLVTTN